ncbi:hypothetical protein BG004_000043 [Podila humilis]|nr:hypothetical protein BG004_000043 [Podila humilis]
MSEFQRGLQAFERLIKSDDGVRAGSCRKCGGGGHLTFECRNTIKLDEPMSKPKTSSRFGFLRSKLGTTKAETLLPGSAPASSETGATVRTQSGKPSFKRRDSSRKKSTPGSSRAKEKYDSADDATSSSSKSMSSGSESDSGDDRRRQNRGRKSRPIVQEKA